MTLAKPSGVETLCVSSAEEMYQAVMERAEEADLIIKSAAVADFRPVQRFEQKAKKGNAETMSVELERNPDILAELGQQKGDRVLVGFAAETEELLAHAQKKLEEKNLDLIVANDVTQDGAGFDCDTNIVRLLFADGRVEELAQMSKAKVAETLGIDR